MRARHVMGVIALAALAGCSSPAPDQVTVNAPIEKTPVLPACSAVFVPGQLVDKTKASAGCLSPSGNVNGTSGMDCTDGTVLWQVDATTGAPAGYAREGKPYRAVKGEIAADTGYKRAYGACLANEPAKAPTAAKKESLMGKTPAARVAVDITTPAGQVQVGIGDATPTTPRQQAAPETTPTETVRTPRPGGEWANAPKTPTTEPTADPA